MKLVLIVGALVLAAGGEPETARMSLTISAYSSRPDVIGFRNAHVRIESVWLSLRDAKVRPAASCKRSSAKAVIASPFAGDIASPRSASTVDLQVSRYCSFELMPARSRLRGDRVPVEVHGASIVVVGKRADGARFVVRSELDSAQLLAATDLEGVVVKPPRTTWILGVDLDRWFAGVDLASAEVGEKQRTILIDETSNQELLRVFDANVPSGFALFPDANHDGVLDTPERSHPIATAR